MFCLQCQSSISFSVCKVGSLHFISCWLGINERLLFKKIKANQPTLNKYIWEISFLLRPYLENIRIFNSFLCISFLTSLLEYNALQWCVSFCCITKWISYTYTYMPISPPSCVSLPPSLSHPSRWSESTELTSLCYAAASCCFPLAICFTFGSVYMSMPLSHFVPAYPSPSPCPQVHSLRLHLYSCPAPRFEKFFLRLKKFFFNLKIPNLNLYQ